MVPVPLLLGSWRDTPFRRAPAGDRTAGTLGLLSTCASWPLATQQRLRVAAAPEAAPEPSPLHPPPPAVQPKRETSSSAILSAERPSP